MATIKEISVKCGVSISTVSKVLNGYREIGEETTKKVLDAAEELGYIPNVYARQMKLKKSYHIGVVFSTLSNHSLRNEYFAHILASFRETAAEVGYDIAFVENNVGRRKMTYLEHCRYRNFDGVCIVCADFADPEVIEVINSDFPVVTIDFTSNDCISVLSDNTDGMRQLIEYIIQQGHRRIAYIHGNKSMVTHNRLVSYHKVLAEYGIEAEKSYLAEGEYRSAEKAEAVALEMLKLKERPTCIIASDDYAALGVIKAVKGSGLKMPGDVSVAGYDGISVSQALVPKLTTVKQDTDKMGRTAAKQLIKLMESPMTTTLGNIMMPVMLEKGESVRSIQRI